MFPKMKRYIILAGLLLLVGSLAAGCGMDDEASTVSEDSTDKEDTAADETDADETAADETDPDETAADETDPDETETKSTVSAQTMTFVDVFGESYEMTINDAVVSNPYSNESFLRDGDTLSYEDEDYTSRMGIDVSYHQGEIDWEKVKAAGYEFAFIRVGYRGYGEAGKLFVDSMFYENVVKATNAGLDVGVYFFSQAINEEEAAEEAELTLDALENAGVELALPVVFDPENILDDEARTDNVTGEQFTKNTIAFCETIEAAGYETAVYANMLWEAFTLELEELSEYPVWYADYEEYPQTPYDFTWWQYDNEATVDGVEGNCDVNIQIIPR